MMMLLLGTVAVTLLTLLGAGHACPEILDDLGLDYSDMPRLLSQMQNRQKVSEALEARIRAIGELTAAKEQVARDLLTGRLTIVQAAARLRDLPGVDCWHWDLA